MNIPNALTLLRILAIPALVAVLAEDTPGRALAGFWIFGLASLTDWLDGLLARRKNLTTPLGQLLDPTADKLLVSSALICLVGMHYVPAWMAVVIIARELAVSGFRAIAATRGLNIPASVLGKSKMALETWTIMGLLLGPGILGKFYLIPRIGLWLVFVAAVASAAEYYIKFGPRVLSSRG